jgi:hypothetical protein
VARAGTNPWLAAAAQLQRLSPAPLPAQGRLSRNQRPGPDLEDPPTDLWPTAFEVVDAAMAAALLRADKRMGRRWMVPADPATGRASDQLRVADSPGALSTLSSSPG